MDLWIARHGPNDLDGETYLDRERALTPRGIKHVVAVAAQLKIDGQAPKGIFTSVFKRTMQTADIIGKTLNSRVIPCDEVGPEVPLCSFFCKLFETQNSGMMMVGHHTNIASFLSEYGDGQAPDILACGEVRRYSVDSSGCLQIAYRITPADVGMPDMITLRNILSIG